MMVVLVLQVALRLRAAHPLSRGCVRERQELLGKPGIDNKFEIRNDPFTHRFLKKRNKHASKKRQKA
jgi:hypothetical protein